jgi:hypothetical protein
VKMTLAGADVLLSHTMPAVQNTVKKIALSLSPVVGFIVRFMALLQSPKDSRPS